MLLIFIILGFIQGITEPIPVSSSGHLLIFQKIFDVNINYEILAIITNLGSFLAIVLILKDEIKIIINDFVKYITKKEKKYYTNYRYCLLIIVASIPAGLIGLIITKLKLFNFLENNAKFVGLMLLITSLFLYLIKDSNGFKDKENISFKDAFIIGLFQVIALIPGISRSGSTIVGSMFNNLKRETAFNFSFMLYIPISIAVSLIGIKDLLDSNLSLNILMLYLLSSIVAFIFTYISLNWFKKIITNGKLIYFVYYCLLFGILTLIFL
jgi:undecaprenyl-diphosphatase